MTRVSLVAFAFLSCATAAYADTQHISRTLPLKAGGRVIVNNFSGHIRITGVDGDTVSVNAERTASADELQRITLDITGDGSTVTIEANRKTHPWFSWWGRNDVVTTDLDIRVPRRADVDVHAFSSPIEVSSVDGRLQLHSFSARIDVTAAGGAVRARTFSGAVAVTAASWREGESIDVDTFSGSVVVHAPESARGTVQFRSFSGGFTSEQPLVLHATSRRDLSAELQGEAGGPSGAIRVKTFSGSLRLER